MYKINANHWFYLWPTIFSVIFLFTSVSKANSELFWSFENKIINSSENKNIVLIYGDLKVDNFNNSNQNACSVPHSTKPLWSIINNHRTKSVRCGRKKFSASASLRLNCDLMTVAQNHAEDLQKRKIFSHQGSDGATLKKRVNRIIKKWSALAENLAYGTTSPSEVHALWLNSPSHCINMSSPDYNSIGIGRAGDYWVAVFGDIKD